MMVDYTVINLPYSAMLGVISPSPRTRTVASTYRFVGAFGAALLISLFVRPLVEYLGAGNESRGFQLTMAIFAVVSVVLILITFATTKERVAPPTPIPNPHDHSESHPPRLRLRSIYPTSRHSNAVLQVEEGLGAEAGQRRGQLGLGWPPRWLSDTRLR